MIRPGPASIPAGAVPGGLVVHAYTTAGELLAATTLDPAAAGGPALVLDAATWPGAVVLVAFDGDTGERWTPLDWLMVVDG